MYKYVLIAALINGTTETKVTRYYDSQSVCLNMVKDLDRQVSYYKDFCKYVKDEWFPNKEMVARCEEEEKIQHYSATCTEE